MSLDQRAVLPKLCLKCAVTMLLQSLNMQGLIVNHTIAAEYEGSSELGTRRFKCIELWRKAARPTDQLGIQSCIIKTRVPQTSWRLPTLEAATSTLWRRLTSTIYEETNNTDKNKLITVS
jgi:hypothetical protein